MARFNKNHFIFILVFAITSSQALAATITLKVASFRDNSHEYYHELLIKSLEGIGYKTRLIIPEKHIPQKRAVAMLDSGELSLLWRLQSKARDAKYPSINCNLTNGLIGHRILFIPKGRQSIYDHVKNLDDFRKLDKIGGFGINWFDTKVWRENHLKYFEQNGEWRVLYKKLARGDRGIDYFSRGLTEILGESKLYPYLDIEAHLLFLYNRDFRFYLSPYALKYKKTLEKALTRAKNSGLIQRLIHKYWGNTFSILNLDKRIKIRLKTPK